MSHMPSPPPPVNSPHIVQQPYGYYNPGKGYGIAALILGIVTLIFVLSFFLFPVGIITGIIGIILGRKGMNLSPPGMRGMATGGFVCSIIGLGLLALGIIPLLFLGGLGSIMYGSMM